MWQFCNFTSHLNPAATIQNQALRQLPSNLHLLHAPEGVDSSSFPQLAHHFDDFSSYKAAFLSGDVLIFSGKFMV